MVPGEAVSLYAMLLGIVKGHQKAMSPTVYFGAQMAAMLLTLAVVIRLRSTMTDDPGTNKPQWKAITISVVSFIIYAYAIGGPFAATPFYIQPGWQADLGFGLAAFWTLMIPKMYSGE
jgi:hypothetical protein